ncbi:hypothetical protein ABPG72_019250 [Tetrahymena utriculariae]
MLTYTLKLKYLQFDSFFESLKKCNKIIEINLQFNAPQVFKLVGLLEYFTKIESHNFILEKVKQIEFKRDKLNKQIVSLSLSQISNNLNVLQLQAFLEGIKYFPNLKKFKFKFSNKNSDILLQAKEFQKQIQIFEQLETLSLQIEENSKINEDGMKELVCQFQLLKNIGKINLDIQFSNEIGFQSIVNLFSQLAALENLVQMSLKIDIKNNSFVQGQYNVNQSLQVLKQLKKLKISLYDKEVDDNGGNALQNWIANQQTLQDLQIDIIQTNSQREIHDQQTVRISEFSKCLIQLTDLNELSIQIYSNPIQNEGLRDLACKNITQLSMLSKLKLSFYENKNQIMNGITELFQSIHKIKTLNFLKFQANFQHSKVLILSIPYFEQEQMFIQVQEQQTFLQLNVLNIQFNYALSNEELSNFSFNLKLILNLEELIINVKKHIKTDEKSQLNIQGINILLENLGQCQSLKYLSLNTETEYDYTFLRLLSQQKQIKSMYLFRNQIVGFKRNQTNNDITELNISFKNSMGGHYQMDYLKYMIESLQYFDKLTSLIITFNNIGFIEFEKNEILTIIYDEELETDLGFSIKQLKQSINDQIFILINEIQNNKSIKYFEILLIFIVITSLISTLSCYLQLNHLYNQVKVLLKLRLPQITIKDLAYVTLQYQDLQSNK